MCDINRAYTDNAAGFALNRSPFFEALKAEPLKFLHRRPKVKKANILKSQLAPHFHNERWGAGVETQKNVRGEVGGWGRAPFNEPYATQTFSKVSSLLTFCSQRKLST